MHRKEVSSFIMGLFFGLALIVNGHRPSNNWCNINKDVGLIILPVRVNECRGQQFNIVFAGNSDNYRHKDRSSRDQCKWDPDTDHLQRIHELSFKYDIILFTDLAITQVFPDDNNGLFVAMVFRFHSQKEMMHICFYNSFYVHW